MSEKLNILGAKMDQCSHKKTFSAPFMAGWIGVRQDRRHILDYELLSA